MLRYEAFNYTDKRGRLLCHFPPIAYTVELAPSTHSLFSFACVSSSLPDWCPCQEAPSQTMASRTLSDPLTLLREYTTAKRPVTLEGEHVVFGRTRFLRSAKTAYRSGTNGDGEYYAVDSVWSLLQHGQGGAADYAKACGLNGITPIRFPDRRKLLAYLKGEESDSRCVDYSNYETVQPVGVDASGEVLEDSQVADDTMADFEVAREAREPKLVDPAQIEAGRAAFRRLLEVPKGVAEDGEAQAMEVETAGEPSEEAGGADEGAPTAELAKADEAGAKSAAATDAAAASKPEAEGEAEGKQSAATKERLKQAVSAAKPFIRFDRDQSSAIVKRERHMRSRATVLQAASSAGFPAVQAVLESFRKRNRAALAQKEKARQQSGPGTAAVPLASSGTRTTSRDAPTSGHPMPPQPPRPAKSMSESLGTHARPSSAASSSSRTCIFVVPAAITAIVNMYNVRELLETGEYTPAAERKAAGATKEASISITHTYDDGTRVSSRMRAPLPMPPPRCDHRLSCGLMPLLARCVRPIILLPCTRRTGEAEGARQPAVCTEGARVGRRRSCDRPGHHVAIQRMAFCQGRGRDFPQDG